MITYINIDTILSDPLLLTATILVVVGPLMFLVSLWNLLRSPKKKDPLFDPKHFHEEEPVINHSGRKSPIENNSPAPVAVQTGPKENKPLMDAPSAPAEPMDMEKTIVMPAGMAEIQGQLEIAFSQIKHLNKKVFDLEKALASGNPAPVSAPSGEPSSNVPELAQKLLKLAEHVIVLEKNLNKLMANKSSMVPTETTQIKPPIMPL